MKHFQRALSIAALLVITSTPTQAVTWNDCFAPIRSLFEPKSLVHGLNKAESRELRNTLSYPFAYEARLLGRGYGGSVYRIYPNTALEPFIVKRQALPTTINDAFGYELLERVKTDLPVTVNRPTFRKAEGELLMEFKNIEGNTLFDVLTDTQVPDETKRRLSEIYLQYIQEVERYLETKNYPGLHETFQASSGHYPSVTRYSNAELKQEMKKLPKEFKYTCKFGEFYQAHPDSKVLSEFAKVHPKAFQWYSHTDQRLMNILIKSDNFIVSPDYQRLILIDPH